MTKVSDIALSSRVRLARNIVDYPFPNAMAEGQRDELIKKASEAINANGDFMLACMGKLPLKERLLLVEKHLISPDIAGMEHAAALINKEETISILIGEEDHIRIQCLQPGLGLEQADILSVSQDMILNRKLEYAFDPELGYLTACPTNLGSGMRASVMLHLPALFITGQTEALLKEIGRLGFAVRGIYGEGSNAPGHIYQVSNQMTLGMLEEDIIGNLNAMVQRIMEREQAVREQLFKNNRLEIEDLIYRSLGALRYARKMESGEAMEHISNLKLAASLDIIENSAQEMLTTLLREVQIASLEKRVGRELGEKQRDSARTEVIRETLGGIEIKDT